MIGYGFTGAFGINPDPIGNGGGSALQFRGMGQGLQAIPSTKSGGASIAQTSRVPVYSNSRFRYFRVCLPTFMALGSNPIVDTDFPNNFQFQVGIEYPYTASLTGIPARLAVTFGGSNVGSFDTVAGPFGWLVSDVIDIGSIVPAGTRIGIWTTIESAVVATNQLPVNTLASNFVAGRFSGMVNSATSLIATNNALSATSILTASLLQTGVTVYTPGFLLIQDLDGGKSIISIGDSITYGIGEGAAGSGANGDCQGDANCNSGLVARYVVETLGHNHVNFGRSTDGFKFLATSSNWKYRQAGLTLANPTHVLSANGQNDLNQTNAATITNANTTYSLIHAAVPGIPVIQFCIKPNSTSTDAFATVANQTAGTGSGNSTTNRGKFNNLSVRNLAMGNAGFIDANPILENGYVEGNTATETSLWIATGTADGYTADGIHPNSIGAPLAAANMYASLAGVQVSDPFV